GHQIIPVFENSGAPTRDPQNHVRALALIVVAEIIGLTRPEIFVVVYGVVEDAEEPAEPVEPEHIADEFMVRSRRTARPGREAHQDEREGTFPQPEPLR